jgi:hypothetical protein
LAPEEMIEQTRELVGPPRDGRVPRVFDRGWPGWLERSDSLKHVYRAQRGLLDHGHVVWAWLVQANQLLFEPGRWDAPAAVVYSDDPYFDASPEELGDVASAVFELKGRAGAEADVAYFAEALADEVVRDARLPVPSRLTNGAPRVLRYHRRDARSPPRRAPAAAAGAAAHPPRKDAVVNDPARALLVAGAGLGVARDGTRRRVIWNSMARPLQRPGLPWHVRRKNPGRHSPVGGPGRVSRAPSLPRTVSEPRDGDSIGMLQRRFNTNPCDLGRKIPYFDCVNPISGETGAAGVKMGKTAARSARLPDVVDE